jgi:hypothetical protein
MSVSDDREIAAASDSAAFRDGSVTPPSRWLTPDMSAQGVASVDQPAR